MTTRSPVSIFKFNTSQIRVVDIKGVPWFVAADVCKVLGMTNITVAIQPLSSDEKGLSSTETLGGNQRLNTVSESGLYKLILRSRKPNAAPFQDWVTRVVLPAIRKDGGYILGEEKVATGEMFEFASALVFLDETDASTPC